MFTYHMSCLPPGVSINSVPLHLSLLSNMPAFTLLSPFLTMRHLVIDEIPPSSHLTHIPDLYTANSDNHQHLRGGVPPVPNRLVKK